MAFLNKKIIIITAALVLIALAAFLLTQLKVGKKTISQNVQTNSSRSPSAKTFPAGLQKLINDAKSKQQPIKGGYYLLVNNQMVVAYNEITNQFIVTALGKKNEEIAKKDSSAYFKNLGVSDMSKLKMVYRTTYDPADFQGN